MYLRLIVCVTLAFTVVLCRKHRKFEPGEQLKEKMLAEVDVILNNFAMKQDRITNLFEKLADTQRRSVTELYDGIADMWLAIEEDSADLTTEEYLYDVPSSDHVTGPPLHRHRKRHRPVGEPSKRSGSRRRASKHTRLPPSLHGSQTNTYSSKSSYPSSDFGNDNVVPPKNNYPKSDSNHPKSDTYHPRPDSIYPRPDSNYPKSDSNYPRSESNYPKSDSNFPRSDSNYPKSDSNYPRSDSNYPKSDSNFPRSDTFHPRSDSIYPRPDTNYPSSDSKTPSSETNYPADSTSGDGLDLIEPATGESNH